MEHTPHDSLLGCRIGLLILCMLVASAAMAEPLRLTISRTPLSLPFYVAMDQKLFEAEGLELEIQQVIGGYRAMRELLQGQADLATPSDAVIMFNSFDAPGFVILASFVGTRDDLKVIVGPDSGILSATDLPGKRVGTVKASASHYYLDTLAILNGVHPKQFELVELAPEAMEGALAEGRVDAVAIWHPFAFQALNNIPGARMLDDDRFYNFSFNLVATPQAVKDRREEIVQLLAVLDRSIQFIHSSREKVKDVLYRHLDIDPDYGTWLLDHFSYRLELQQGLIVQLESEARWAIYSGTLDQERVPNYLDLIEPGPLHSIAPDAVKIVK